MVGETCTLDFTLSKRALCCLSYNQTYILQDDCLIVQIPAGLSRPRILHFGLSKG
jgi:hypothetical protein